MKTIFKGGEAKLLYEEWVKILKTDVGDPSYVDKKKPAELIN